MIDHECQWPELKKDSNGELIPDYREVVPCSICGKLLYTPLITKSFWMYKAETPDNRFLTVIYINPDPLDSHFFVLIGYREKRSSQCCECGEYLEPPKEKISDKTAEEKLTQFSLPAYKKFQTFDEAFNWIQITANASNLFLQETYIREVQEFC